MTSFFLDVWPCRNPINNTRKLWKDDHPITWFDGNPAIAKDGYQGGTSRTNTEIGPYGVKFINFLTFGKLQSWLLL